MVEEGAPLDPEKTILVVRHGDKEVGRIPATAPNAGAYLEGMVRMYGECTVDYEADPTNGLLAELHRRLR
jgi:hypothetical protein